MLVNADVIKPEGIVVATAIGEILFLHFAHRTTKTVQILAVLNQASFHSHLTLNSLFLQHFKVSYLLVVLLSRGETRTNDHKDHLVDSEEEVEEDAEAVDSAVSEEEVEEENVARSQKWNAHQRKT